MKISVFGMGYVGCVTAAALSRRDNYVVGVDVNQQKVQTINRGEAPVLEKGLAELVAESVRAGRMRATANGAAAVVETDLSLRMAVSIIGIYLARSRRSARESSGKMVIMSSRSEVRCCRVQLKVC